MQSKAPKTKNMPSYASPSPTMQQARRNMTQTSKYQDLSKKEQNPTEEMFKSHSKKQSQAPEYKMMWSKTKRMQP